MSGCQRLTRSRSRGDEKEGGGKTPEFGLEELRSCDQSDKEEEEEEEEESQIFNSFRRLFIMEPASPASPSDDSSGITNRTGRVAGDTEDAFVVISEPFVEPMDQSPPSLLPMPINDFLDGARTASSDSSPKDGKRISPKRTLSAILDEESDSHQAGAGDVEKPTCSCASSSAVLQQPVNLNDVFLSQEAAHGSPRRPSSTSSLAEPPPRESPKRPSDEQPEGSRVSPKRLSLQFRPERISSTSTPFGQKIPTKGVRALIFDNQPPVLPKPISQPIRRTRLSSALSSGADYSLDSIAENPPSCNDDDDDEDVAEGGAAYDPFTSPADQSSIIAHGFPSSFFYSPWVSSARSTSGNASVSSVNPAKGRSSMPGPVTASPSTQRFRQALSVEITRRLSLDNAASGLGGTLPVSASPSKHPMLTRSSSTASSTTKEPEFDSSKWPVINKYSLYEALSQESGYWTRSRCRDVTTESQLASGSQTSDLVPSSSASHVHHDNPPFCCVPDTPPQFFLRKPVAKCKREAERIKEEEKARRKKEISIKITDYLGTLKSLPPSLWIGRHIGLENFDMVPKLHGLEPSLVQNIMTLLDDASLKSFSMVSTTWSSIVREHKASRTRLQAYDDLVLAIQIQTRENTPLNRKSRQCAWASSGNSSIGRFSASSDLTRSFLGSDASFDNGSIVSAFTPQPRVVLKPVLRQASVNQVSCNPDNGGSCPNKQTRPSMSPVSRSARVSRSPRANANSSNLRSPSRSNIQSPSRRGAGFQSPSRRSGAVNVDVCRSPHSPFGRVLSPCRSGSQSAQQRFGQRRLFTSPSKKDAIDGRPPLPLPTPGTSSPSVAPVSCGRQKLLISAMANNARASPQPSLESSSRRLFESPAKSASSSGYDLRSQGFVASSTDQCKSSAKTLSKDEIGNPADVSVQRLAPADENSAEDREKTPLSASNYQAPSSLSGRRSLSKSHNKSANKSKQKLRRL